MTGKVTFLLTMYLWSNTLRRKSPQSDIDGVSNLSILLKLIHYKTINLSNQYRGNVIFHIMDSLGLSETFYFFCAASHLSSFSLFASFQLTFCPILVMASSTLVWIFGASLTPVDTRPSSWREWIKGFSQSSTLSGAYEPYDKDEARVRFFENMKMSVSLSIEMIIVFRSLPGWGRGPGKAYTLYARDNVDNCERSIIS